MGIMESKGFGLDVNFHSEAPGLASPWNKIFFSGINVKHASFLCIILIGTVEERL